MGTDPKASMPGPFSFELASIDKTKALYRDGDPAVMADVRMLLEAAQQALGAGPFSVTNKNSSGPSDDLHDYVSLSRYKWPNPDTPDGLPHVKRDGQSNPELDRYDRKPLGELCTAVSNLALAYHLIEENAFAEHATSLIRTWFLDTETRMNANFNHGSFVPGVNKGSKGGIIASVQFLRVMNSIRFLAAYKGWSRDDQRLLQAWFRDLRDWILKSEFGRLELASKNNHGTWVDSQVVCICLFVGDMDLARRHLFAYTVGRIADHFAPDGS